MKSGTSGHRDVGTRSDATTRRASGADRRVPTAGSRVPTLLVLAALGAMACGRQAAPNARSAADAAATGLLVDTVTVGTPLELPAQLYVEHDAGVVARSAGTVDSVAADLGTRVARGALLARLEHVDQELALAQAEEALASAERLVARARVITRAGGITVADSELVESQYRQADLARRKARRDLELTRIVAPFAGVVTARYARRGRFVNPGDTLFRLTEGGPLLARVRMPEAAGAAVRVGARATVVGLSGATADAAVMQAAPAIDPASGTREVVLRLAGGGRFLPGASVTVRLGEQRRRVVAVPRDAVAPEGFVLVVENGGTSLRPVTLGADVGGGRVEVVSGLSPGERVAPRAR